jgi:hypothetical protein
MIITLNCSKGVLKSSGDIILNYAVMTKWHSKQEKERPGSIFLVWH